MRTLTAVLFVFAILAGATTAGPLTLVQGGWTSGGPLTVSFDGVDGNLDGQIDQAELSAFNAVYQLPLGGSTAWALADLQPNGFLFMNPGDFLFFASNPEYTLIDSAFQGLVSGSVINAFLFPVGLTDQQPVVVPEPAGMAFLGLAVLAIAVGVRRRSAGGPAARSDFLRHFEAE